MREQTGASSHGSLARAILGCLAGLVLVAEPAAAYIDPGTGSMIVQGLIAAVVGGAVALRMQWRRVKGWLTGGSADEPSRPEADEPR